MQGLVAGATAAAAAGGVNVMLAAGTTARICLLQALSPVGRCKTFDASGDGYGRGEAFAVALLGYARCDVHNMMYSKACECCQRCSKDWQDCLELT